MKANYIITDHTYFSNNVILIAQHNFNYAEKTEISMHSWGASGWKDIHDLNAVKCIVAVWSPKLVPNDNATI